jgi:hypothetical protein
MFGKGTNSERAQFHNSRRSRLDLSYTSLEYFVLFRIGDIVPYGASALNLMFDGAIKFGDSQMKYAILQSCILCLIGEIIARIKKSLILNRYPIDQSCSYPFQPPRRESFRKKV